MTGSRRVSPHKNPAVSSPILDPKAERKHMGKVRSACTHLELSKTANGAFGCRWSLYHVVSGRATTGDKRAAVAYNRRRISKKQGSMLFSAISRHRDRTTIKTTSFNKSRYHNFLSQVYIRSSSWPIGESIRDDREKRKSNKRTDQIDDIDVGIFKTLLLLQTHQLQLPCFQLFCHVAFNASEGPQPNFFLLTQPS